MPKPIFRLCGKHPAHREPDLPEDVQVLAHAGRFDPRKGIDTVVRALRLREERPAHPVIARGDDRRSPSASSPFTTTMGAERRRLEADA